MFANGDLAAVNFDGSVAWTKYLGPIKNTYGYGASLAVWGNSLLIQLDQGETPQEGSKLISLLGATGRVLWERSRPVSVSWATPIVGEAAGKTQIITVGKPLVIAYAQTNGNELWRAELLDNEVVPSPVFAGGLVLVLNPGAKLIALRPDGAGEVTTSGIAWAVEGNFPGVSSPVTAGNLIFTVSDMGMVKCLETSDGKQNWETDLGTEVDASPGIVGDRVVVLALNGTLVMFRAARELQKIGRMELPDKFFASPAFAGGRVFLRGATNLFCLGPADQKLAKQP
jgi:outer membrane protein assembly factor BamB